jgi:tRNA(His) 5'-end guanylyltransferase
MNSNLGDRMKTYEKVNQHTLTNLMPVVIRLDGRAFHSKTFEKPFDDKLQNAFMYSVFEMIDQIENVRCVYFASDEVSIVMLERTLRTHPWFGNKLNKIISVSASMLTYYFNRFYDIGAQFDSRAFNVPVDDVVNYMLWRGKDWERNSLSMLARHHFSHKELQGKSMAQMHDMLFNIGVNWATDLDPKWRNGTLVYKTKQNNFNVVHVPPKFNIYNANLGNTLEILDE